MKRAQALGGGNTATRTITPDRVDECDVRGWLFGALLEDAETAPVPAGCHACYLTAPVSVAGRRGQGERCRSCPDHGKPRT